MAAPDVFQFRMCCSCSIPTVRRDSRSTKCSSGCERASIAGFNCASRPTARVNGRSAATTAARVTSNSPPAETLRALEDALLEFAGSVMVISHDRWFLDRIATHILAAEGDSQWVFFDGNYQEYEADKKKRLGEEGAKPHRLRFKPIR